MGTARTPRREKGGDLLIQLELNGKPMEAEVWPGASLLHALREDFHLPGSKNACEQGECGSCSVWLDDEVVCACLVLAAQAAGKRVTTVEGLSKEEQLHPMQEAFVRAGAVQCGFCTPGLVVAAADLLKRDPSPSDETIKEALAGNLCRCTGYSKILEAVHLASEALEGRTNGSSSS
jgi:aerobic carbon-monoxide dehydrogenase small subunit